MFFVYSSTDSYRFDHVKTRRPIEIRIGDEDLVLTEYYLDSFSKILYSYDDVGIPLKIHYVRSSNLKYLPYVEEVSP